MNKHTFCRLFAIVLTLLLALTAAVSVLAEPEGTVDQDNLEVIIHNNEGLPAMSAEQFKVYQLFTGSPAHEGGIPSEDSSAASEWEADQWNNWTLADVQWGASIKGEGYDHSTELLKKLTSLTQEDDAWAYFEGVNAFEGVDTAAKLAEVLAAHKENDFLQKFADIVANINLKPIECPCAVSNVEEHPEKDSLTFTIPDTGYYLFVEVDPAGPDEQDATSEYILAVVGNQEINLKASVPTVDKDIVDGEHGEKGDVAGVGDYVQTDRHASEKLRRL